MLLKSVSGTKLIIFLVSFFTFFIALGAFVGVGMGLSDLGYTLRGLVLILTFLIFSLPLLITSYLLGRFSREKRFSATGYSVWSFIGTLPLYLFLPHAFVGVDYRWVLWVIVLGLIYAVTAYIGTTWGYRKKH